MRRDEAAPTPPLRTGRAVVSTATTLERGAPAMKPLFDRLPSSFALTH